MRRGPRFPARAAQCLWCLLLVAAGLHAQSGAPGQPRQYLITRADGTELKLPEPALPDISGYSEAGARGLLESVPAAPPEIEIRRVFDEITLDEFTAAERAGEWAKRQNAFPRAIFLKSGLVRPADIARALQGTPHFVRARGDAAIYVLRLPLVVEKRATLLLENEELRLSQERGAFLAVDGRMFTFGARLIAWNEALQKAAAFRDEREFRPFLVSWSGSELYLINSYIESFGYLMAKSYGITISSYPLRMRETEQFRRGTPKAWIVGSEFVDMYYGFYCYHAHKLVVKDNTYRDNILYGIDPHDYSSGLIIAGNTVSGTRNKHGIIVSRAVTDSLIFNNRSFNNRLSGFVIDRNSTNNLIAYNESFHNGSNGLTLYESSDNLIWENFFYANGMHGVSARNSTDVRLYKNRIVANGGYGVYGHVKDLSDTDRDFELDPYDSQISLTVTGGVIAANRRGSLSIDRPLSLEMYDIDLRFPRNSKGLYMEGALASHHEQLMEILFKHRQAAILHPLDKELD